MPTDTEQHSVEGIDVVEAVKAHARKCAKLDGDTYDLIGECLPPESTDFDVIADLCVRLAAAEREAGRLRGVVDKLLKTADGVPITPDMDVYVHTGFADVCFPGRTFFRRDFEAKPWVEVIIDGRQTGYPVTQIYSCKDAFDAALAAALSAAPAGSRGGEDNVK